MLPKLPVPVLISALFLILLTGCSVEQAEFKPAYQVTVYSGGEAVKTYNARSVSYGGDRLYVFVQNGTVIVAGDYSSVPLGYEPTDSNKGKFVARLYSGGTVVGEWPCQSYDYKEGYACIFITTPDGQSITLGGSYIVEPR